MLGLKLIHVSERGPMLFVKDRFPPYIDDLVYDCSNSSALTMDVLQSCTKPSI